MPTRQKKDNNPLVLKLGVALALSFAGFLCSRLRNKYSSRPSLPTPPSPPSDVNEQAGYRGELNDDVHATPRTPTCPKMASNSEAHGSPFFQPRIDNGLSNSSPSTRHSSDRDGFLLPEFNELVEEFDIAPSGDVLSTSPKREIETPVPSMETGKGIRDVGKDEYEQEIQRLRSIVSALREQERSLEIQLLEYYGLKEQEVTVMELQNRLKINNVETRVLCLKIKSLQAENRRLEARVVDYLRVVDELEAARAKIKVLKTKLRSDAEQNKEQILRLKKRVLMLDQQEKDSRIATSNCELDVVKLQRLEDLENEREELRKSMYELQKENSELSWRLESTQTLATSMLEDLELGELANEVARLRLEKENLVNEVETLQSDRCADAEELVYLRWVNACLRHELRNYHPPPGKTVSRDLSKSLSPKSEAKAKQLIFEYANKKGEEKDLDYDQWSPSQSYKTDSGKPDESLADANVHHSKKLKIFDKLRRLISGKDKNGHKNMHNKGSTLVRSHSVEDFGKAYSFVQRRNSISTPSQNLTSFSVERSLDSIGSSASSSSSYKRFVLGKERSGSISPSKSRLDKGLELSLHKSDLVSCGETLKDSFRRTRKKSASYGAM